MAIANVLQLEAARCRSVPIRCNSPLDRQVVAHVAHNRTQTLPILVHAMVIEVNSVIEVDGLLAPKDMRSRHIPTQVDDESDILVMMRWYLGKDRS